jgi:hypothetical protein
VLYFLLSMNEVKIKYLFRDFQNNVFIDFKDELGLFNGEKSVTLCFDWLILFKKTKKK